MSYKILDLRTGECFVRADIFDDNNEDAVYDTLELAQSALDYHILVSRDLILYQGQYKDLGVIREYFEIIETTDIPNIRGGFGV